MKLTERKKMILIHIAWILALAVILWPLFTIAKYDYPSADDWSFGKYMYRAMQAGEGIAGVFHAIYQTLAQNVWEARFSILILSALQPAAFGEHFYRITPVPAAQRMHCGPDKGEPLADPAHRYSHGNSPGALLPLSGGKLLLV